MIMTAGNMPPYEVKFTVPAGATVKQVLLYWNGFHSAMGNGDDTLTVDGGGGPIPVTGTLIGGPVFFFTGNYSSTYRADITALGLIGPGMNVIEIADANFDKANNGATILAIIDDPASQTKNIQIFDGQDLAFINFAPPLDKTVTQTYTFVPSDFDRFADVALLAGSVQGPTSGADPIRPNKVIFTFDGSDPDSIDCSAPNVDNDGTCDLPGMVACCLTDPFASINGPEWDHVTETILVEAGVDTIKVEAYSAPDNSGALPASFAWIASALAVPEFCEVEIDKQISCNGGVDWVDVTPDAGIESCIGWDDGSAEVQVRYLGRTESITNLMYNCTLTDSNGVIIPGNTIPLGNLAGNSPFPSTFFSFL